MRPRSSAALLDGTADAIATDHAPHTEVDKAVEFGLAANGISGIETALGVLLAAVDAGRLPLARAIAALTLGPAAVLGTRSRRSRPGLDEGAWRTSSCSTGRTRGRSAPQTCVRAERTRRSSGERSRAGCC